MEQRQEGFWQQQSEAYVATLKQKNLLQKRIDELKPVWEQLQTEQVAEAQANLKDAKEAEAKETDKEKKKTAEALVKAAEAKLASVKETGAFVKAQQARWEAKAAYASDAYRLLASNDRCLNCHQVGPLTPKQPIGPPLDLAPDRLRSDWLLRWIASPQRLLIYPDGQHPMPGNFKSNDPPWPEFAGSMLDQVTAVRDVLIDYPKVSAIPENRAFRPPTGTSK
jgi:hypothetical protein